MKYILSLLLLISSSNAVMTLKVYKELKNKEEIKAYVIGIGRGILSMDTFLTIAKKENLFCLPKSHVDNGELLLSILNNEIEQNILKYKDDAQIENIMVMGFINKYPCK